MSLINTAAAQTDISKQPDTNVSVTSDLEATKAPSPKEDPVHASKFAILAKKEKALLARLKAAEEKEKALALKEAEFKTQYIPKTRVKDDPIGLLRAEGYSNEEIAQKLLNQPSDQDYKISLIDQKLAALEEAQAKFDERDRNRDSQQYEDAKKQTALEVKSAVDGNPEFETIAAMDAYDSVVQLIEDTLEEDGQMLAVPEAAKLVEEYLLEEAMKFTALNKVKLKLSPESQAAADGAAQKQESNQKQVSTLSNRHTTSNSSAKPLSYKERRARAILAYEGKL